MTSKVTIDAHAGWPIKVTQQNKNADDVWEDGREEVVAPHTVQDFYVYDSRRIVVEEQRREQE